MIDVIARVPIIRESKAWKGNRVVVTVFPRTRELPGFVTMECEPVSDPMLTPFRAEQLGRALVAAAKAAKRKPR